MNVREWIKEYKKRTGCQICCYHKHPEILEFHHVNRIKRKMDYNGVKIREKTIGKYTSIKKVRKAISSTCILLCPICHKLIHRNIVPIKD